MNTAAEICPIKFAEAMNFPMEQRLALLAKLGAKLMKTNHSAQAERSDKGSHGN